MILSFFSVEEKGQVKPLTSKSGSCRNRDRDSFICGTVKYGFLFAELFEICFCVKFSELGDAISRFDLASVYKIGDSASAFGDKITEFEDFRVHQKLNKLSFVAFHLQNPPWFSRRIPIRNGDKPLRDPMRL